MKINLLNTADGLKPCNDNDYENKKRLKIGTIYTVDIKVARNYEFHKKFFALINCAWEYQNEKVQKHFKNNIENFRKTVQVTAGHCNVEYSIKRKEWVETSKSISFDNMDNLEFESLYNSVKDVLFAIFLKDITEEEFNKNLIHF